MNRPVDPKTFQTAYEAPGAGRVQPERGAGLGRGGPRDPRGVAAADLSPFARKCGVEVELVGESLRSPGGRFALKASQFLLVAFIVFSLPWAVSQLIF